LQPDISAAEQGGHQKNSQQDAHEMLRCPGHVTLLYGKAGGCGKAPAARSFNYAENRGKAPAKLRQ
jgi:hypothetical protein